MVTPSKIRVLPEQIANRIAAGEVIERPASVVRELLDNAVDAGAGRVDLEIRGGGRALIAVRDNGVGIEPDGMLLAFERHATSKIHDMSDLDAIRTLGFRGEALPSIASVAKIVMESMAEGADMGARIVIEGGTVRSVKPVACRPGTYIQVKSLFYNVPARRKFLRSPRTEYGHVLETVIDHALTYPGIHFTFRDGDRTVIEAPAVDRWVARFRTLFGDAWLNGMLPVSASAGPLSITGYISEPDNLRSTARSQRIYINGRRVRDRIITQAVYSAYKEYLSAHGHPVFVLKIDVHPEHVDINVHPAKSEVRFRDPNMIFSFVNSSVHDALSGSIRRILSPEEARPCAVPTESGRTPPGGSVAGDREELSRPGHGAIPSQSGDDVAIARPFPGKGKAEQPPTLIPYQQAKTPYRVIGQLFKTFILLEMQGELLVIDQHTAHERILFERFKTAYMQRSVPRQSLLFPVPVELDHRQADIIGNFTEILAEMGVGVERFGGNTYLVRSLPEHLKQESPELLLKNIADELLTLGTSERGREAERRMLISLSCRRAVKAGDTLGLQQMESLIDDLIENGIPNACPHGRPVVIRLSEEEIRRRFKR